MKLMREKSEPSERATLITLSDALDNHSNSTSCTYNNTQLLHSITRPSDNFERYGSFNPFSHSNEIQIKNEQKPWEDEHNSLEDRGVRQMALEFNLGLMFNTCLSIIVDLFFGREHVISFVVVGSFLCTAIWTVGKYVLHQADRERAEYEYQIERQHLKKFPEEEKEELKQDLLKKGLSLETVHLIFRDLASSPDKQADLHTLLHLGLNLEYYENKSILNECLISLLSIPFGCILTLFPFLTLPGINACVGCIFLLGMLSLASGALLSLKASKSAGFYAIRQFACCVLSSILCIFIAWIIENKLGHYSANHPIVF